MPYISEEDRRKFGVNGYIPQTPGELNFAITRIVQDYVDGAEVVNYALLNEIVGVLESAKLEFYRRVMAPYETKKISENGDVYYVEGVTTDESFG